MRVCKIKMHGINGNIPLTNAANFSSIVFVSEGKMWIGIPTTQTVCSLQSKIIRNNNYKCKKKEKQMFRRSLTKTAAQSSIKMTKNLIFNLRFSFLSFVHNHWCGCSECDRLVQISESINLFTWCFLLFKCECDRSSKNTNNNNNNSNNIKQNEIKLMNTKCLCFDNIN